MMTTAAAEVASALEAAETATWEAVSAAAAEDGADDDDPIRILIA